MAKPRDYQKENEYKARPEQIKMRVARNKARREAIREGRVKKGDGKEIDHIIPLSKGGSTAKSNLRVVSKAVNRKKGNKSSGANK